MILGTVVALTGIAIAYYIWVRKPGTSAAIQARFRGLHTFLSHKWYFDELIDAVVVRPWQGAGVFCRTWFEKVIVDGVFIGGATGVVKAGSSAVRALQTGFLRYYAALLLLGGAAVLLYFLIAST